MDRLALFYNKKSALVQLRSKKLTRKQDPGSFATYKNNDSSGGVMAMIEGIVNESKALETEAIQAEQDAQSAYEQFVQDSNKAVAERNTAIAEKEVTIGNTDGDKVSAEQSLKAVMDDLGSLNTIGKALHNSCDFTLANFEMRQGARDMEVEALRQSVAMLSGSSAGR